MSRTFRRYGLGYGAPRRNPDTRLDERLEEFAAPAAAPPAKRRGRPRPAGRCEWCSSDRQTRRVAVVDRRTGESAELILCAACGDDTGDRTVWLRYRKAEP
jgi:hypothetical protein